MIEPGPMQTPSELEHKDAQHAVTRALNSSLSEEEAIPRILAAIGESLDWVLGGYWELSPQDGLIECRYAWHRDSAEADHVLALNRRHRFRPGEGLPGRVWARGEPEWLMDVQSPRFPRIELALKYDLGSAVAFPVYVGRAVVGVLEFLADQPMVADDRLIRVLEGIGSELGSFIRRNRVERELRASEHRFRSLAETASDAIVTIDERSTIEYANPAVERLFGYQPEELIGRKLTQLMPERMRAGHDAGIARYLRTSERKIPWAGMQLPALHKSGREFPVEISFSEYATGEKRAFTGFMRDISERVQQQQALEEATAELEVTVEELQERTAEAEAAARVKTDFLAAMSHELRTPLQAVIGYAGLLEADIHGPLNDDQRSAMQRIHASATHLLGLIDQVLDIARAETGRLKLRREQVNLCELVTNTAELVRPQAEEKGLELIIGPCPDARLHAIVADPGRIRQIVLNLLSNAVKFTQAGSIRVDFGSDERVARIMVRDTGVGIAADQLARVFEKFYQTEAGLAQRQPGIGLGLAISRDLARSMNGEVEAVSTPGEGSMFTLVLPLVSPASG